MMVGAKQDDKLRLLPYILIDPKLFKLGGALKACRPPTFLLHYRLLPHNEDPNNEVAKEANSQNKKKPLLLHI